MSIKVTSKNQSKDQNSQSDNYQYLYHLRTRNIEVSIIQNRLALHSLVGEPISEKIKNVIKQHKKELIAEMETEAIENKDNAQLLKLKFYKQGWALLECDWGQFIILKDDVSKCKLDLGLLRSTNENGTVDVPVFSWTELVSLHSDGTTDRDSLQLLFDIKRQFPKSHLELAK